MAGIGSPRFDAIFIGGVLAIALLLGSIGALGPDAFRTIIYLDVWLLAYPHVAATFGRVAYDHALGQRRVLLLALTPIVLFAATSLTVVAGGVIALNSVYFYWQSYHYARQSYGIARAYRRAAGATDASPRDLLTDVVVFAFPIWGVVSRVGAGHPQFYAAPLYTVAIPSVVVNGVGAIALGALILWLVRLIRDLRSGARVGAGPLFVLSHVGITVVSYLLISDITSGWLFVNVWHNAQYLVFVWAANTRRHAARAREGAQETPRSSLIGWLSKPRRVVLYAAFLVATSAAFYAGFGALARLGTSEVLPLFLIFHMSVNFYHYVVDAVIWRAPRPNTKKTVVGASVVQQSAISP